MVGFGPSCCGHLWLLLVCPLALELLKNLLPEYQSQQDNNILNDGISKSGGKSRQPRIYECLVGSYTMPTLRLTDANSRTYLYAVVAEVVLVVG